MDLILGWYHQLFILRGFKLLHLEGHITPINNAMDANLKDILLPIAVLNVAVLVTMGTFFVVYSSIDPINATQLSSPTISYCCRTWWGKKAKVY